jgi:hypothetical protein
VASIVADSLATGDVKPDFTTEDTEGIHRGKVACRGWARINADRNYNLRVKAKGKRMVVIAIPRSGRSNLTPNFTTKDIIGFVGA